MQVVRKDLIDEFCVGRERAVKAFDKWMARVRGVTWYRRLDARATFPATDPWTGASGTEYLIFDVGGNKYRVVAWPDFESQSLVIKAVMTHDEYADGRWKKGL